MPESKLRRTSLALAGGNALGAYAAGAYEALHGAGYAFDLVSGSSIGAVTAAIIAGNAPGDRVDRLREFWQLASRGSAWGPAPPEGRPRDVYNKLHAMQTMLVGRPGLFAPRASGFWSLLPGTPPDVGLFDGRPMIATLERLADFDRINDAGGPALVVGCVDLESGEAVYFDSRERRIEPRHVLASTAFIPGFPPVEIDGRCLGDPGMFCNLPLDPVLGTPFDGDQLCFAVDLFDVQGERPASMDAALERAQDIAFASQSLRSLRAYGTEHSLRHRLAKATSSHGAAGDEGVDVGAAVETEVVLVAYRPFAHELGGKTLEFSGASIAERWASGRDDMDAAVALLRAERPSRRDPGFAFYDGRRIEPRERRPRSWPENGSAMRAHPGS